MLKETEDDYKNMKCARASVFVCVRACVLVVAHKQWDSRTDYKYTTF